MTMTIIIIIIIITMYIDKHNRRSHIITTFSDNIYFMTLQLINCIKSLTLTDENKQYTERGLPVWQLRQQPSRLLQRLDVQHSLLIHHSQPQCSLQHWWQEKSSVSKSCLDYGTETYKRHVWMWTDIIGRAVTEVWGQEISICYSLGN